MESYLQMHNHAISSGAGIVYVERLTVPHTHDRNLLRTFSAVIFRMMGIYVYGL